MTPSPATEEDPHGIGTPLSPFWGNGSPCVVTEDQTSADDDIIDTEVS